MQKCLSFLFVALCAPFLAGGGPAAAQPDDPDLYHHSRTLVLGGLASLPPTVSEYSLSRLYAHRDLEIVPSLILAMRYNRPLSDPISETLKSLTGETEAKTWFDWMLWQEAHPEIIPHPNFVRLKEEVLTSIDPNFGRFVPLSPEATIRLEEIVWGGVRVDGIPSLDNPKLIPAKDADYLIPGELVFGVEINGDVRAYPLRILDWHEMLNDVVGGVPVSLAYCTLCGSGILFDGRVGGVEKPLTYGSSGLLYRSNKLMYDRNTGSLWNQFTGRPVSGPLAKLDIELNILPVAITSWRDWQARHPDTKVLSLETGHVRDYTPDAPYGHYFNSPDLMFPALANDETRPLKDYVFGVRTAGGAKAWPMEDFNDMPVINDRVGLTDVVVIGEARTRTARAYRRDGHEFEAGAKSTELRSEDQTWTVTENALVGPSGERLPRIAGHVAFWFAWSAFIGEGGGASATPG